MKSWILILGLSMLLANCEEKSKETAFHSVRDLKESANKSKPMYRQKASASPIASFGRSEELNDSYEKAYEDSSDDGLAEEEMYSAESHLMAPPSTKRPKTSTSAILQNIDKKLSKRSIYYEGSTITEVEENYKTKKELIGYAESLKGYMTNSSTSGKAGTRHHILSLRFKIPRKSFFTMMRYLKNLGKNIDYTIKAKDITQKIQELETRIKFLEKTLSSLNRIYETTKDTNSRLSILRTMKDVSKRLEDIHVQATYFKDLASYSVVKVELRQTPKFKTPPPSNHPSLIWLSELKPFTLDFMSSLKAPKGFAVHGEFVKTKEPYWLAEDTQASSITLARLKNQGKAHSLFWAKAYQFRYNQGKYRTQLEEVGKFQVVHLQHPELDQGFDVAFLEDKQGILVSTASYTSADNQRKSWPSRKSMLIQWSKRL